MYISKKGYKLVYQNTGKNVYQSALVESFRGESFIVKGGNPPHKPSSSGRIWVTDITNKHNREFFPSVCGLKWVEV
tara:strand:- start:353 stop:580 length:228 start_codon:yes stop_codon:yes gene_type:complete